MIDHRFRPSEFDKYRESSTGTSGLATELQDAIAREAMPALVRLGREIAEQLNALGHSVRLVEHVVDSGHGTAEVTFVDDSSGASRESQKLRFNLDLTVSAGYPDYSNSTQHSE